MYIKFQIIIQHNRVATGVIGWNVVRINVTHESDSCVDQPVLKHGRLIANTGQTIVPISCP